MKFRRNKRKKPGGMETLMVRAEEGMRLWIDGYATGPHKILIFEIPEKEGGDHERGS